MRYGFISLSLSACLLTGSLIANEPRMNEIQTIGTHNSYRVRPPEAIMKMIAAVSPDTAKSLDYTHRPLVEQLDRFDVRQIELDVFADPRGGLYADPIGRRLVSLAGAKVDDDGFDAATMRKPGMKILHSPGFDYATTTPTFVAALRQVRQWSQANPKHVPILILVELKESAVDQAGVTPVKFDADQLNAVDAEIRSVFAEEAMLTPDDVRGAHPSLREALRQDGWPKLSEVRGQVWFAMDNQGALPQRYLEGHASLRGRVMFTSVGTEHEAAAFLKRNDPIAQFDQIRAAVRAGLIVRTRADADTRQARAADPTRRERALASGAQYISTDYIEPDARFSQYQVALPGGGQWRGNPLLNPGAGD